VDVRVPADAPLRIDGFDHVGPYSGIYFDGQKVAIEWAGPAEGFRGWMLDGAPAGDGSRLECAVAGDRPIAVAVAPYRLRGWPGSGKRVAGGGRGR
jgi:hypothetical protein